MIRAVTMALVLSACAADPFTPPERYGLRWDCRVTAFCHGTLVMDFKASTCAVWKQEASERVTDLAVPDHCTNEWEAKAACVLRQPYEGCDYD